MSLNLKMIYIFKRKYNSNEGQCCTKVLPFYNGSHAMIYNFQEVATGYRRYVNGGERRTCPYMVMATMGKCRQTGE